MADAQVTRGLLARPQGSSSSTGQAGPRVRHGDAGARTLPTTVGIQTLHFSILWAWGTPGPSPQGRTHGQGRLRDSGLPGSHGPPRWAPGSSTAVSSPATRTSQAVEEEGRVLSLPSSTQSAGVASTSQAAPTGPRADAVLTPEKSSEKSALFPGGACGSSADIERKRSPLPVPLMNLHGTEAQQVGAFN